MHFVKNQRHWTRILRIYTVRTFRFAKSRCFATSAFIFAVHYHVYDISHGVILDANLCPFGENGYDTWKTKRNYLASNRIAERIIYEMGGEESSIAKRRLSLSDCFWLKHDCDANVSFFDITPYNHPFSLMTQFHGSASSDSIPELVLCGSLPKQWGKGSDNITYMRKTEVQEQIHAEMLAVKLLRSLSIPCMNAFVITASGKLYANKYSASCNFPDIGVINLVNITNLDRSLIQFDQLNVFVNGFDIDSVAAGYAACGVDMPPDNLREIALLQVLSDYVVGNIDRKSNNSNWSVFMDNASGLRAPSHLYDFNWASLYRANPNISEVAASIIKSNMSASAHIWLNRFMSKCEEYSLGIWKENAVCMIDMLS